MHDCVTLKALQEFGSLHVRTHVEATELSNQASFHGALAHSIQRDIPEQVGC